jgi:undecaprenyl diphosphate synthase
MKDIPNHVAIIMDGNGRWAKKNGLTRLEGHKAGARSAKNIVTASREKGVKYLTLYAFSYENWKRPKTEIIGLFHLLETYCKKELSEMMEKGIEFNLIGEWGKIPPKTKKILKETIRKTENNNKMRLILAINYSSRREILNTVNILIKSGVKRVTEKGFIRRLFTYDMPDPDLIIRTSGELRLSNFLLWQAAYAEFAFTETLWPDFTGDEYLEILQNFAERNRRYGGI